MIAFPNCKINLGLHVTGKRADGYHDLETVFYPVPLCDALEIIPSTDAKSHFRLSGVELPPGGKNLCEKAWELLAAQYDIAPAAMHLHKAIPAGAGLGGGSADATFTLRMLNDLFGLQLSRDQLLSLAAQLGSDCSFFIHNTPCFATGRGEILSPLPLSLKGYTLLLVKPHIHISTAEAFAGITPRKPTHHIPDIVAMPPEKWTGLLTNDFEPGIFSRHPVLAQIKSQLYQMGAVYAAMSGSGATVFGLFAGSVNQRDPFPGCFVWSGMLG